MSDNILDNGNTEINRTSQFESCSIEAYKIVLCICKKLTVIFKSVKILKDKERPRDCIERRIERQN